MENKKTFQAYYTKSRPIVDYMINLLELEGDETILEPGAGDGVFIDFILEKFPNVKIDAFEYHEDSYLFLKEKFEANDSINVKHTDTLADIDLDFLSITGGHYDAVIANPPYGAWREQEDRIALKKRYPEFYAKESYTLFLYRSIEALKVGGKLSFIIPDTYLNLNMHKATRDYLLKRTKIKEISLFPSSFFPGVNFGYANLSIISLVKHDNKENCLKNKFRILKGFKKPEELGQDSNPDLTVFEFKQQDIFNNYGHAFLTHKNPEILSAIQGTETTIGDICECVTGFYSGNDKVHLKVLNKEIRNSKKYEVVDQSKVTYDCSSRPLDGISGEKIFVPIVKGGNVRYYKPDNWFMEWSVEIVDFYKKDKKARYQNSSYYFKKGIAVPMVSSTSITGALIENRLFDQSIVGIFPEDENLVLYLLAFFNSPTCNTLIRTINPSTNNSSNYIKKIPFKKPNDEILQKVSANVNKILLRLKETEKYDKFLEEENNSLIKKIYGF